MTKALHTVARRDVFALAAGAGAAAAVPTTAGAATLPEPDATLIRLEVELAAAFGRCCALASALDDAHELAWASYPPKPGDQERERERAYGRAARALGFDELEAAAQAGETAQVKAMQALLDVARKTGAARNERAILAAAKRYGQAQKRVTSALARRRAVWAEARRDAPPRHDPAATEAAWKVECERIDAAHGVPAIEADVEAAGDAHAKAMARHDALADEPARTLIGALVKLRRGAEWYDFEHDAAQGHAAARVALGGLRDLERLAGRAT